MDGEICKIAERCASSVNEGETGGDCTASAAPPDPAPSSLTGGIGVVSTTSVTGEPTSTDTPTASTGGGGGASWSSTTSRKSADTTTETPDASFEPETVNSAIVIVPGTPEATEAAVEEVVDDALAALDEHADTLSNPKATEEARKAAEDALLDALGGGYGPDVRLQVAASLARQIDLAYFSLLEKQVVAIRDEARGLKDETLVQAAEQLLEKIRGAVKNTSK
jgi:hypothetical protein